MTVDLCFSIVCLLYLVGEICSAKCFTFGWSIWRDLFC
jgi:hypothetical protein